MDKISWEAKYTYTDAYPIKFPMLSRPRKFWHSYTP